MIDFMVEILTNNFYLSCNYTISTLLHEISFNYTSVVRLKKKELLFFAIQIKTQSI